MSIEPKLFIHIPKTGGSSLYHGAPELITSKITTATVEKHIILPETTDKWGVPTYYFEFDDDDGKYRNLIGNWQHARIRDIKPEFAHSPFTVIRNPWSRTISRYFYSRKNGNEEAQGSFEEWLESRHTFANVPHLWLRASRGWYSQLEYITNEEGKVVCDIMRHENYDEDLRLYLDLPKDFIMPKINVGNYNGVYKEIYTPETIQIVADWHKDDIDYFGFDFDTAATRNYWNEA
jgi:hypothetical protein